MSVYHTLYTRTLLALVKLRRFLPWYNLTSLSYNNV